MLAPALMVKAASSRWSLAPLSAGRQGLLRAAVINLLDLSAQRTTPECQYCLNAALILNVGSRTNMMVEIMLFWLAALPILLTQGQSLSYFIVVTIKNCKSRNQLSV